MSDFRFAAICLTPFAFTSILAGCADEDPVSSYLGPNPHSAHSSSKEEQVLLGAIVPYKGQGWFFKAVGPPDVVELEHDHFRQFIRSLDFTAGETRATPTWTVPQGWRQHAGSGMRYATLRFGPADSSVELTVIGLPTPDVADNAYILLNVNRWREELQLPSLHAGQLASTAEIIPLEGTEATVVHMRGEGRGQRTNATTRRTPEAPASPHPSITHSAGVPSHQQRDELKYAVPDGWRKEPNTGMRKAAFSVSDGEQSVEITVIDLVAEAGELLPNVNRWREQIGLQATTAKELAAVAEEIGTGAAVGDYVALVGSKDASRPQTIFAAVVLHGGKSWFIKLMGDSELAAREEERFKSFVRSVKF